jgi:hypothetical protein
MVNRFKISILFCFSLCIQFNFFCMFNDNRDNYNRDNYRELFDKINKKKTGLEKFKAILNLSGKKNDHLEGVREDFFLERDPIKRNMKYVKNENNDFKLQIHDTNEKCDDPNSANLAIKINDISNKVDFFSKAYDNLSNKLQQAVLLISDEQISGEEKTDVKDKQNKILSLVKIGILGYLFYCQFSDKK